MRLLRGELFAPIELDSIVHMAIRRCYKSQKIYEARPDINFLHTFVDHLRVDVKLRCTNRHSRKHLDAKLL